MFLPKKGRFYPTKIALQQWFLLTQSTASAENWLVNKIALAQLLHSKSISYY